MSREIEIANIKEAMNGADNTKMITPYSLNQVIKRKAGSGSGTPGVGLNYYWNGTELGVKREDEENYTFVDLKGAPGVDGEDGTPGTNGTNGADGEDGREVELQVTATHIQWRYVGSPTWVDLIALLLLKGADGTNGTNGTNGKQVQLQKSATHIQWKYDTDVTWTDLVALVDLKGADGEDGQGVPVGGTTGQVLKKKTNTDFDTEWGAAADPNAIKSSDGSVTDIREVTQAEYDALTQAEKDEGTFFITDDLDGSINVINGFDSTSTTDPGSAKNDKLLDERFNYSTSEQVVGKWINNKLIYRKVIEYTFTNIGALNQTNNYEVQHGIQNIEGMLKCELLLPGGLYFFPYISTNSNGLMYTGLSTYNNNSITLRVINDTWSYLYAKFICYYTKTTD